MVVISKIAKKKNNGYKKIKAKYYLEVFEKGKPSTGKWVDDIDKATLYSKTDALMKTKDLDDGYIYSLVFDVDFYKLRAVESIEPENVDNNVGVEHKKEAIEDIKPITEDTGDAKE